MPACWASWPGNWPRDAKGLPVKASRNSVLAVLAVVLVAAIAIGSRIMVWSGGEHATASIGGSFTLVDGDGKTVTDADFRGKWMLIYFGYTFCPDVCPTALSSVAAAMDKLSAAERFKLTPIFITVDPTRDTPAVMKDYAAAFHPKMVGLTGSEAQVAQVMKAYKVYGAKAKAKGTSEDATTYTVDHSSILYLVGPDGRFVAHFPHGTTVDDLTNALKKFLK
ncbi:MAG: SCO family protein [Rhodospirillaceae bacterium]|nr:SCO family protein [Rhodospirillales bacterium]